MSTAAALVRNARRKSGLTQRELATRLGTTQTAVARLEREGSNPRLATLERTLRAAGHDLELRARRHKVSLDEPQLRRHLRLTPSERARVHDAAYRNTRGLVAGARKLDG